MATSPSSARARPPRPPTGCRPAEADEHRRRQSKRAGAAGSACSATRRWICCGVLRVSDSAGSWGANSRLSASGPARLAAHRSSRRRDRPCRPRGCRAPSCACGPRAAGAWAHLQPGLSAVSLTATARGSALDRPTRRASPSRRRCARAPAARARRGPRRRVRRPSASGARSRAGRACRRRAWARPARRAARRPPPRRARSDRGRRAPATTSAPRARWRPAPAPVQPRRDGGHARAAGTCWVMQCGPPPPKAMTPPGTPTTSRSG